MRHLLTGATPEPLSGYLVGLGVLRCLALQGHPATTACWDDRGLMLETALDQDALMEFFLHDWVPTPMVSPWNKGAGFRGDGKSKSAEVMVQRALASDHPRLAPLRTAISVALELNQAYPDDKEYVKAKDQIIQQSRARMPDAALDWIDAAVTMTADGPVYPHILGTGGNFGRLDLSANVLDHLDSAIGLAAPAKPALSRSWLEDALFGIGSRRLRGKSVGQFEPGMAGGTGASSTGEAKSLANPWTFLLQLEGSVVFASGLARRLGNAGNNVAAMPFTVRPDASGATHLSAEENAKGELWLPLWDVPATYDQVRRLFAEGRMRWNGRTATRGVDAARAVATLGAQRGVSSFSRVSIVERLGQNPLAIPAGRFATGARSAPALTAALDAWLNRARRIGNLPTSVTSHLQQIDQALLEVSATNGPATARALRRLLVAAHGLEAAASRSESSSGIGPCPPLSAMGETTRRSSSRGHRRDWLAVLSDGTAEFRLATALTSAHDDKPVRQEREKDGRSAGPWRPSLTEYLRPIAARQGHRWDHGPRVDVDIFRDLVAGLADIHASHAQRPTDHGTPTGSWSWFDRMLRVSHGDVEALVADRLDLQLLAEHLLATCMVGNGTGRWPSDDQQPTPPTPASPAWRLLTTTMQRLPGPRSEDAEDPVGFKPSGKRTYWPVLDGPLPDATWIAALARGSIQQPVSQAMRQLRRAEGHRKPGQHADQLAQGADGPRLAAALLFHLTPASAHTVAAWSCPPDDLPDDIEDPTTPREETEE